MTTVMSWILELQGRCTIKSVAKFQASMFAGVAPDLVCRMEAIIIELYTHA